MRLGIRGRMVFTGWKLDHQLYQKTALARSSIEGHIEAHNLITLGHAIRLQPREGVRMNNRNLIIGGIIVIVVIAGYFLMTTYQATTPQPAPTANTETKK